MCCIMPGLFLLGGHFQHLKPHKPPSCFAQPSQANVVCVVYDVTNEDTIEKVTTGYSGYVNQHHFMLLYFNGFLFSRLKPGGFLLSTEMQRKETSTCHKGNLLNLDCCQEKGRSQRGTPGGRRVATASVETLALEWIYGRSFTGYTNFVVRNVSGTYFLFRLFFCCRMILKRGRKFFNLINRQNY